MAGVRRARSRWRLSTPNTKGKPAKSGNRLDHCYRTGNAFACDVEGAAVRDGSKQDGASDRERCSLIGRLQLGGYMALIVQHHHEGIGGLVEHGVAAERSGNIDA